MGCQKIEFTLNRLLHRLGFDTEEKRFIAVSERIEKILVGFGDTKLNVTRNGDRMTFEGLSTPACFTLYKEASSEAGAMEGYFLLTASSYVSSEEELTQDLLAIQRLISRY